MNKADLLPLNARCKNRTRILCVQEQDTHSKLVTCTDMAKLIAFFAYNVPIISAATHLT